MALSIATAPEDLSLSKSAIKYILQAQNGMGVPYDSNTIPDGYEVTIQLLYESTYESGNYDVVSTLKLKPDSNARVEVDLSLMLDNELQSDFPSPQIPAFSADEPYLLDTLKRYYIDYKEDYTEFAGSYNSSPVKKVLYGGLYQEEDFFSNRDSSDCLLGKFPDIKRIDITTPDYLAWYNWNIDTRRVYIEAIETLNDGTNNNVLAYSTNTIDVQAGQVIIFPVGPSALGLNASTIAYTVQVVEQSTDTRFSELRKYRIERNYKQNLRHLAYLNIFGAPQVIACTGLQDRNMEMDRKVASVLQSSSSILRYAREQYAVDYAELYTYRTGYITLSEVETLDDLIIHNQLYETTPDGFTALIIETNSVRYQRSGYLFSLEFSCRIAVERSFGAGTGSANWTLTGGAGSSSVSIKGYDQLYPAHISSTLVWTRNSGVFPSYTRAFVQVYEDGVKLTEGNDYTITHNTAPGESTITLLSPISGANYSVVAQCIVGGSLTVEGYDQLYPAHISSTLVWTRNSGVFPSYTRAFVQVYEDGVKLTEGNDYTITHNTAPGESTITLLSPISGANYSIVTQYISI